MSYGDNEAFPLIGYSSMDCASTPSSNHLVKKFSSLDSQPWLTCQISLLACLLVAVFSGRMGFKSPASELYQEEAFTIIRIH